MKSSLIDSYKEYFNLQDATFSRIHHEDAMVAICYKVTNADGKQYILKVHERKNDYFREIYFLNHFANKIKVPHIFQVFEPNGSKHGAILMKYVHGNLLNPADITEDLAYELGTSFALIHQNNLSGYGDPIQENLSDDPSVYFTFKFEEGLNECKNHLPEKLLVSLHQYYQSHLNLLHSVDGPCMVHRDFRPGNLIVDDGKLQGIIDWASARASFAEEDFCSLEHTNWLADKKQTFLSGYATIRPIPNFEHLIPFLRLSKAIATIGFTVKQGTWKNVHAKIYQFNLEYLKTLLE